MGRDKNGANRIGRVVSARLTTEGVGLLTGVTKSKPAASLTTYRFGVGQTGAQLSVMRTFDTFGDTRMVAFYTANAGERERNDYAPNLPVQRRQVIGDRLERIIQAEVADKRDGTRYTTIIGAGNRRNPAAIATYRRMGFSTPQADNYAYAHVQNGRLVPGLPLAIQAGRAFLPPGL